MAKRRCLYLAVLLFATVFYWANQQWLGWLLLLAVLLLPILSLVLSLPGIFALRMRMTCPTIVQCGETVRAQVTNQSWFPAPVRTSIISVYKPLTKTGLTLRSRDALPTEYCGKLFCRIEKVLVMDYLGLFNFRLKSDVTATVTVLPKPITFSQLPPLQQRLTAAWKPKPGGGFAENHEVRLYRPGDNLNQIHWKLSAKTGKLVIREPMIPAGLRAVVGLCLCGTEEQLDRKFGKLMGVCTYLLDAGIPFELQAVTAEDTQHYPIAAEQDLHKAVDELLGMEPAAQEEELTETGAYVYWIGGDTDDQ